MEFSKIYNRDEFLNFLRRDFLPDDFSQVNEPVVFATKTTYSKQATKLGVCKSLDLIVYEIKHSGKDDPRVGLSKEAFRMLSEEWQSRALVLFVPENNANNYRFSLIEIKLEGDETSAKVHRKYSNPRRYSYLLGEGIGGYTPNKYLAKGKIRENDQKDLQDRFSVEVLTKAFYNELSDWYAWAIDSVEFPGEQLMDTDDRRTEHRSKNVIRLLTRLLFVWFLKQKNLIPWQLFNEDYLSANLLKDFAPNMKIGLFKEKSQESRYYRAILQNLFFATLNCPITPQSKEDSRERGFRKSDWYGQGFGEDHLMRYESEFTNAKHFLELVNERVPFLNGGLFDCLDDKQNKTYIDGFSDNLPKPNRLKVPDFLFFGESQGKGQDISAFYGDKKKKSTDILGLVDILKKYNFTIEENMPFDQEVSLDPELLGKVFENLLASYNPETKTTARNTTGSFYTPREIVQYMVDESLVAHLKRTVGEDLEEEYRKLMRYTDEETILDENKRLAIIQSLQNCKVLDPACGSGAFPVGVLQQMVHILSQLDPHNVLWKNLILDDAVKELSSTLKECTMEERDEIQADINRNFDDSVNRPDYARKLYLIENCIYGVDIQSIAVQISKLRFFISLVVDQKPTQDRNDNFGIRPLPNLEAKFVTANTLIGLKKGKTLFDDREIDKLQDKLSQASHRIFGAKSNKTKNKHKARVEELQGQIAERLEVMGVVGNEDAHLMRSWKMFDQNASSPFFDSEWMFGVSGGFDIVIGNPPYGVINKKQNKSECIVVDETTLDYYKTTALYKYGAGGMLNIYRLFILKSIDLLSKNGFFVEIFPLAFVCDISASKLRRYIVNNCNINFIEAFPERDNINKRVFESAKMSVCILGLSKKVINNHFFFRINNDRYIQKNKHASLLSNNHITTFDPTNLSIPLAEGKELELLYRIYNNYPKFSSIGKSNTGEIDMTFCKTAFSENIHDSIFHKGAIIDRYILRDKMSQGDIQYINENLLLKIKNIKLDIKTSERIVHQGITGVNECSRLKMMIINNAYCANSLNYLSFKSEVDLKYYLGIFNSKLLNYLFSKFSTNSNVNGYEIDNLPMPLCSFDSHIANFVEEILTQKKNDRQVDTSAIENEIDLMVYKLYGLTYDEVLTIDPKTQITQQQYEDEN